MSKQINSKGFFSIGASRKIDGSGQGFFSIDAAFALLIAITAFVSFSILLSTSAKSAQSSADSRSSSLLALRLSSEILLASQERGGAGVSSYTKSWEIDIEKAKRVDIAEFLEKSGRKYASIALVGEEGEMMRFSEGTPEGETYCARRLALVSGQPIRLEVCVS